MSVFAAPGSGKTTVLTNHILHQLQQERLSPSHIMAVTFTRQSAQEMKARIQNQLPPSSRSSSEALKLGTFHAQIFAMLLSRLPNIPVLLDPREQLQLIRTALQLQRLPDKTEDVRWWTAYLSRMKSVWPVQDKGRGRAHKFLHQYELLKRRSHRWDFDDILIHACKMIDAGEGENFVPGLRYLLMDEFQDTNGIQWHIVRHLTANHVAKLFVVGDDDQCIYGFRGANPQWLLNFRNWYPEAQVKVLEVNFRSDARIIQASRCLIQRNRRRHPKEIVGASREAGLTEFCAIPDEEREADCVLQQIQHHHGGTSMAVLARTRRQLVATWTKLPAALRQRVEFRTFHDAKGKEWDTVHIVGAVADNPYLRKSRKQEPIDDEEERRLFYVAMTRARHELYIYAPGKIGRRRYRPIPYIEEAGISLSSWQV